MRLVYKDTLKRKRNKKFEFLLSVYDIFSPVTMYEAYW